MKKIFGDAWFSDLRDFRPLFPELSDPLISTLLASIWSERESSVSRILGKSDSTIRKQRMTIVDKFGCEDFYAAKEIGRFRINILLFVRVCDVAHK